MSKIAVNEITDEVGTGAPAFPNGMSVTGAALTDPEITGGIYLGGTGSANYLDDYEEGTWTPTFGASPGDHNFDSTNAYYVKVGKLVYAYFLAEGSSNNPGGSSDLQISLPFAAGNSPLVFANGSIVWQGWSSSFVHMTPTTSSGNARMNIRSASSATGSIGNNPVSLSDMGNITYVEITIMYNTD